MSDYNSLKAAINANIRKNGRQEITGQVLNGILRAMVDALGAGFTFRAVASPDTDPGSTDSRVFYVATTPGAYEHMGGIEIEEGEVAILKFYDDEWHKEPTGLASQAALESLGNTLGAAIGEKMTFCELWCDGDKIARKNDQTALTFAEVKELMDDPSQFVALKYIDVFWMLPQYDDEGGAIIFTGVSLMSAQGDLWRVAINEENQISDYSIAIENQYLKTDDLTEEQRDNFKTYPTTQAVNAALDDKVNKVQGKGLSSNDFTTQEKNKLAGLNNYDDTELRSQVQSGVTAASGSAAQAAASAASAESKYAGILQAMENLPDGSAVSAQVALNTQKVTELELKVNGANAETQVPIDEIGRYNLQRAEGSETTAFPLIQDITTCNCARFDVKAGDVVHIVASPQKGSTYAWTYTTPIDEANHIVVKKVPALGVAVDEDIEIEDDGLMYVVAKNTLPYSATIIRKGSNGIIERIDNLERWGDIKGKKVLWTGDSICAANELVKIGIEDGGWAGRIAEKYGMVSSNQAVGGSVVTENLYNNSGNLCRSILTKYNVVLSKMPDADYFIFDIGTNDADVIGYIVEADDDGNYVPKANKPTAFGAWNSHDFSGAYDTNTYCGAFETFIYRTLTTLPEKKFGYIVAPKQIKVGYDLRFQNRKAYYDEAVKICRKWGVPILNLWEENTLNPYIPNQYNSALSPLDNENGGYLYIDGQHPSSHGYDKIYDAIARWLNTL